MTTLRHAVLFGLLLCVPGCGGGSGGAGNPSPPTEDLAVTLDLAVPADLSMAPLDFAARADLAPPSATGCHGIVVCVAGCKGMMGCPKTCQMNGTAKGQNLYKALLDCYDLACPTGRQPGDGGTPRDGGGAVGDGGVAGGGGVAFPCEMQNGPTCKDCRAKAGAMGGMCAREQAACDADLP